MLIAWNNMDPVNSWERKKNQLIKELQGDENLYITNYQKIEQLGKITEEKNTDYKKVKEELSEKYSFILDKLSAPVAGFLLMLMSFFVIYKRKKAQRTMETNTKKPVKEEIKKQEETIETKGFLLVSKLGDVAISTNDKNEIIIEKTDKNNPNQQWIFTKANKQKAYFFIENTTTGKVIETAESDSNDGAKILLASKKRRKNDHQEWKLETSKDKGYVFIVNKWSLNVLDVKHKKVKDGTKLQSFHKKVRGTENQEWRIEKI
jgi:hypothetical protein